MVGRSNNNGATQETILQTAKRCRGGLTAQEGRAAMNRYSHHRKLEKHNHNI